MINTQTPEMIVHVRKQQLYSIMSFMTFNNELKVNGNKLVEGMGLTYSLTAKFLH